MYPPVIEDFVILARFGII